MRVSRYFSSSHVVPSLWVTLLCVTLSIWLSRPLAMVFDIALALAAAGVSFFGLVLGARPRMYGNLRTLGKFRLTTTIAALAVNQAAGMMAFALVLTLFAALQCGVTLGTIGIRLFRTRWRSGLIKRIGEQSRARRSRAFWFGGTPR